MKKFLVLYKSKAAIGGASVSDMLASATPEQLEAGMAAWTAWHKKCEGKIADLGAPLDSSKNLEAGKATPEPTDITGYTILEAVSMDEAVSLLGEHPHFHMPGSSIQILECVPMPGM
jgi:hypothetical protein